MRAALILVPMLMLGACNTHADAQQGGSRRIGQRSFQVGAFDKVSLAGSPDVIVAVGGAPSVRAEGDAEMLDRLDIHVENGDLKIGTKRDANWSWGFGHERRNVTIYVTVPTLVGASIGGSGDMKIDKVAGSGFNASVGGSGDMQIGALRVGQASFSIAGSGGITAAGSADRMTMSLAGSGDIEAGGVQSRTATVSVVGSGDVHARAMETADVSVMGSGDVTLAGTAKCSITKVGSGDVHCGG
jgi:hypothetical protein